MIFLSFEMQSSIYILSALIMFLFEYFVLLKLYQRSYQLQIISLIAAPIIIVVALYITLWIQRKYLGNSRSFVISLFLVIILIELPLSLYGYKIEPDASIGERMIVAGSFGVVSVLIAECILQYFSKT